MECLPFWSREKEARIEEEFFGGAVTALQIVETSQEKYVLAGETVLYDRNFQVVQRFLDDRSISLLLRIQRFLMPQKRYDMDKHLVVLQE